jgi:hypothetical protein
MTYLVYYANPWLLTILFTIVLGLAIELPYQIRRLFEKNDSLKAASFSAVQAGLLTLAAFVLGLSFSQSQSRYDTRRALIVKEANAIGTTWLRSNQLDAVRERRFRTLLISYTTTRLQAYQLRPKFVPEGQRHPYQDYLDRSNADQAEMWSIASSSLRAHPQNLGLSLLMETLNDTIDVSSEQLQALTTHVPIAVIDLTLILTMLGAMSLGLRFAADGARSAALSVIFVAASVIVVTMMIDYDRPQTGFIRVNLNPMKVQLQSMVPPR